VLLILPRCIRAAGALSSGRFFVAPGETGVP
jgi:hypothetical protein